MLLVKKNLNGDFNHKSSKEDNKWQTFDDKKSNHGDMFYADAKHVSQCEIQSFGLFFNYYVNYFWGGYKNVSSISTTVFKTF